MESPPTRNLHITDYYAADPLPILQLRSTAGPHILYRIQHGVGILAVCDNGGLVDDGIAANG